MKSIRFPVPLLFLLLMFGTAAWRGPGLWGEWGLPGIAILSLIVCRSFPPRIWAGGAAILGLIALYAWNPTHRWNEGVGLLPVDHVSWLPGSVFPEGTRQAWGLAAAMLASCALAFQLSENQVRRLQMAAMLGAAALALVVLAQRLEPRPFPVFERTGIFINENHYAVFSNLLLPVVLALASRAHFRAVQEGRPSSPAGVFMLVAVLMAAAVVLCRSRAGILVMALLVAAHVVLCRRLVRRHPFAGVPVRGWGKWAAGVAVVAAAALAIAAFAREWHQIGDIRKEWDFRTGILEDTMSMWKSRPAWGTGPGTYSVAYPYYQSEAYQDGAILHAHCEPVQFLSESGLLGGLWFVLAAGLALSARKGGSPRAEQIPPFADLERRAFLLGLLACALHGGIDFPLRVPLIALIAAAWAGVWAGTRPGRMEPA